MNKKLFILALCCVFVFISFYNAQTQSTANKINPTTGLLAQQSSDISLKPQKKASTSSKNVLWDLSRGAYTGWEPTGFFSELTLALEDIGYTVTSTIDIGSETLSDYEVLVICLGSAWYDIYTPEEVLQIKAFVEDGGGLLVMGDRATNPNDNINPIVQEFGITCGVSSISPYDIYVTSFAVHPIFEDVLEVYFDGAGELAVTALEQEAAWAPSSELVVAVTEQEKGRVVVTGDMSFSRNGNITYSDNLLFSENIFNWLCGPTWIRVQKPNGGEVWCMNENYTIVWTSDNYVGDVMIEISTTGGATWWDVTKGSFTPNDGSFTYKHNNVSSSCLYRVTSIQKPNVKDKSDNEFTYMDCNTIKRYQTVHIPYGIPDPIIDGYLNDDAWMYANGPEILQVGGTPNDFLVPWSDFYDNYVTWRALWNATTNLVYVAVEIEDDIAGALDNDYDFLWKDECVELFTDGDHDGGFYTGSYLNAQHWFIRKDNAKHLGGMAGAYTGSAITSAIQQGAKGNWVLELAMAIYDHYDSDIRPLAVGDVIGWEVWYDDSDNTINDGGKWDRDHQVGWGYVGPAYYNADAFQEMEFMDAPTPHPFITVTSPNGNESMNCQWDITWNSSNTSGNVKIEYYCDGSWNIIKNSTLDDGHHNWTVPPNTQCQNAKIKISDVTDPSLSDESDNYFTIHCPGGPCQIYATELSAVTGNTIIVDIYIDDSPEISAFGLTFTYCYDKLLYVQTEPGSLVDHFGFFDAVPTQAGILNIGGFDVFPVPAHSSGSIAKVMLLVDDCTIGESCDLCIENLLDDIAGLNACCGSFTCGESCLLGDVNMDGILSPGDALCSFMIYLNGGTPPPGDCDNECALIAADINCSPNGITPGDALYIFMGYLNGETPPLDCDPSALSKGITDLELNLPQANGNPGEEITISISVNNPQNMRAFGFDLGYPCELLSFAKVSATNLTKDWQALNGKENVPGTITIGGFNTEAISSTKQGALLEVTFKVKDNANGVGDLWLYNLTDDAVYAEINSGKFSTINNGIRKISRSEIPKTFALEQNYPNPFNNQTEIVYQLPEAVFVNLSIYNSLGHKIRTLISNIQEAGHYAARWDGKDEHGNVISSGVYIYRLETFKFNDVKKMMLIK